MPSESSADLASGGELLSRYDMEIDVKHEGFLDSLHDFELFLPDGSDADLKLSIDDPFVDTLLEEDDPWTEFNANCYEFNGGIDIFIKSEPRSPDDSPRSLSCSESSASSEGKFGLESSPVSPPVVATPHISAQRQLLPPIKSSLEPDGEDLTNVKQDVMQPQTLRKVINLNAREMTSHLAPLTLSPHTLAIVKPSGFSSSHVQHVNRIEIRSMGQVNPLQITSSTRNVDVNISRKHDFKLKAFKRQQRMIRNRESACLSRKKKKEYVTSLEVTVSNLEQENAKLRQENDELKYRVKTLKLSSDGEMTRKRPLLNMNTKKATAVLAVLFMVSINIGSIGIVSREGQETEADSQRKFSDGGFHPGRTLLWLTSPEEMRNVTSSFGSQSAPTTATCPLRINQTESIRLEKELRRWIAVDGKRVRYHNSSVAYRPKSNVRQVMLRNLVPEASSYKAPNIKSAPVSALNFYGSLFPGALPRRDDTFYVISFSSHHLLVPAANHNNTLRPKMSFVIPTIPLNDHVIKNGSVPMMQIDCEVLATHSLQFTEKDFRLLKQPGDGREKNNQSAEVKMGPTAFRPYFIQRKKFRPSQEYDGSFELNPKKVF